MLTLDLVEGVLEVDLEHRQLRVLVLAEGVAQRVCDHLDSPKIHGKSIERVLRVFGVVTARK